MHCYSYCILASGIQIFASFFSTWSFLPSAFSGTGATCCLEAISYISFGPFHSFPPMYQGSQAHNTFGHLIDISLLLLFFFFWHKICLSFIVERMPLTDIPNGESRLRKIFLAIYQIQEDWWETFLKFSVKIFTEIMNWSKYHGCFSNNYLESAEWVHG